MKRNSGGLRLLWMAPLVALSNATASHAASLPAEASYYAAEFEPALGQLATIMHLVKDCNLQLGNLCGDQAIPNLDYGLQVIDSIAIFDHPGIRSGNTRFQNEVEFFHRARREQDVFFRLLQSYEEELIARLVALSLVCR